MEYFQKCFIVEMNKFPVTPTHIVNIKKKISMKHFYDLQPFTRKAIDIIIHFILI